MENSSFNQGLGAYGNVQAASEKEATDEMDRDSSSRSSSSSDTVYEVAAIIAHQVTSEGLQLRVRWQSYSEDDDTWEPLAHIIGCDMVLNEYLCQQLPSSGVAAQHDAA